jgi:hypothetical protein
MAETPECHDCEQGSRKGRRHVSAANIMQIRSLSDKSARFLYAQLHVDSVVQGRNDSEVLNALERLPHNITEIYDDAMVRIEQQHKVDKELAHQVLSWIVYARRPLTVEELQYAVSVSPGMTELDPKGVIYKEKLTSVCAGLVVVESGTIRLVRT